ncbi:MAG TPA: choice-of-anchor Q domain-containing protein, partial [Solirubrobacterales bacterium]|nr:choice-of-anchor Q domain-containing protein [Solirubrobacterales bacterium]
MGRNWRTALRRGALLVAIGGLALGAPAAPAPAATIEVTTEVDALSLDGGCSLREAVEAATTDAAYAECPAGTGTDTIALGAGSYALTSELGSLAITKSATVAGAGAEATTIVQTRPEAIFLVDSGVTATIADLALTGGVAGTLSSGGAIFNSGRLTILRSRLFGNSALDGSDGIDIRGLGSMPGGDAFGQSGGDGGSGGAIFDFGAGSSLLVVESELTGNRAGDGGDGGDGFGGDGGDGAGTSPGWAGGNGFGGEGGSGGDGGAIAGAGSVTILRSTISGNRAGDGGGGARGFGGHGGAGGTGATGGTGGAGVGGRGGDGGSGGGLAVTGPLTVIDSTIATNLSGSAGAGGFGGGGSGGFGGSGGGADGLRGIGRGGRGGDGGSGGGLRAGAWLSLSGSLLSGNVTGNGAAGGNGSGLTVGIGGDGGSGGSGAALAVDGVASIVNSTLVLGTTGSGGSGGSKSGTGTPGAFGSGGSGAAILAAAGLTLNQDTITRNTTGSGGAGLGPAGVGAVRALGPATLANSVVAANRGGNCAGAVADGGHNVSFPEPSCPGVNADPRLAPLAANGGPTRTMALLPGSAALDVVPAAGAGCPATDQRGVPRPQGAACDAGAFELVDASGNTFRRSGKESAAGRRISGQCP